MRFRKDGQRLDEKDRLEIRSSIDVYACRLLDGKDHPMQRRDVRHKKGTVGVVEEQRRKETRKRLVRSGLAPLRRAIIARLRGERGRLHGIVV
jgi:hypothetical protein